MGQVSVSGTHRFELFFFNENIIVFIFKKMKTLKSCIQFLYSNSFFFNWKWKLNVNTKLNKFFSSESHEKTKNEYKIHHFLLTSNRPKSQEAVKKVQQLARWARSVMVQKKLKKRNDQNSKDHQGPTHYYT